MRNKIGIIKIKIKYLCCNIFLRFWGIFHHIEKKVLFSSFCGKQYSEDPRAISEKLHQMFPEYKIVWYLNNKEKNKIILPKYIKIVEKEIDFYKEFSTSCAFVTTNAIETNIYKRKGQFIVQTWHGDRGFKKCLYEAYSNGKRPIKIMDNKLTDLCIAASNYGENVYKDAFKYYGKILKIGMPRNEKLIKNDPSEINSVKEKLKIDKNKKLLLYAPTFRDNSNSAPVPLIDINSTLNQLNHNGSQWICLVRSHSASKRMEAPQQDDIINVSDYPDMADLLLISDMLITDYSSCAGDFLLKKKPIILAVFDKMEYEKKCRNLKFPIEESGYFTAKNQTELNTLICNTSKTEFEKQCEKTLNFYNTNETGKASEEICKRINLSYQKNFN